MSQPQGISRKDALQKIQKRKEKKQSLLEDPNFFLEGKLLNNPKFNASRFPENLDLSKAQIGHLKYLRKDRGCLEKLYYVFDVICKNHCDDDNQIVLQLQQFKHNKNPCLLCQSEHDAEMHNLIEKFGLKRDTLYASLQRSGMTLKEKEDELANAKSVQDNLVKRTPTQRKANPYKGLTDVVEILNVRLSQSEVPQDQKDKIQLLLNRIDFAEAKIINSMKNGGSSRIRSVEGMKCRLHPDAEIKAKQLGRLREGANPCPECQRIMRSLAKKGKRQTAWTIEKIKDLINEDKELNNFLRVNQFDVSNIFLTMIKKGGKNCSHISNIVCIKHGQIVEPILINHFQNQKIFCPQCSRGGYSRDEIKNMIIEAHGNTIEPIRLATNMLEQSEFKCNICNAIWSTAANNILGSSSRIPTGCPECSKLFYRNESLVAKLLIELGFNSIQRLGLSIDLAIGELLANANSFLRDVVIKREGMREVRIDYLLNIKGVITALEIDGPQHYGLRFIDSSQSTKIARNDGDKIKLLTNYHDVITCRIPLPLIGSDQQLFDELLNIKNGNAKWTGIPQTSWLKQQIKDG